MLPVELDGAEDGFRDGRRGGDVRADGVEAVLVSGVGERDLLAVWGAVRETSFGCHCESFRSRSTWGTALVS